MGITPPPACLCYPCADPLSLWSCPVSSTLLQAVLRVLVGLLLRKPLQDLPTLAIPLHTVMQLTPTTAAAATATGGNNSSLLSSSSSPYDMQLIHADMTAVASSAVVVAAADSSCPVGSEDSCSLQAVAVLPRCHMGSYNAAFQGLSPAGLLLPEQHA